MVKLQDIELLPNLINLIKISYKIMLQMNQGSNYTCLCHLVNSEKMDFQSQSKIFLPKFCEKRLQNNDAPKEKLRAFI